MSRGPDMPGPKAGGDADRQRREARLAEALRANLRRRKGAPRPDGIAETGAPRREPGPEPGTDSA